MGFKFVYGVDHLDYITAECDAVYVINICIYVCIHTHTHTYIYIYIYIYTQSVLGGLVNILGGGSMEYSE